MFIPVKMGSKCLGVYRFLKPESGLFAVADGMGGAASDEVASGIFSDIALEVFSGTGQRSENETVEFVQKTFQLAHEKILSSAQQNPKHKGMGCTAELIAFYNSFQHFHEFYIEG